MQNPEWTNDSSEEEISSLQIGEIGYTSRGAIFVDPDRRLFIISSIPVDSKPGGTIHLKVTREQSGDLVVLADSIEEDDKWYPSELTYLGTSKDEFIPIKIVSYVDGNRVAYGTLPEAYETEVIENMSNGDMGYTLPWGLFAYPERKLHLVGTFPLLKEPEGTATMKVERKDGEFIVHEHSLNGAKYYPGTPLYRGIGPEKFIPVKLLIKKYFRKQAVDILPDDLTVRVVPESLGRNFAHYLSKEDLKPT